MCVCVLRLGNILVIGIHTASSVCTAHCCITLPLLAPSPLSHLFSPLPVPSLLPPPSAERRRRRRSRKEEWLLRGASAAKVASPELKCHPGTRCAFLTKTLCRPQRRVIWVYSESRCSFVMNTKRHAFPRCDNRCMSQHKKVTSLWPCALKSVITATGSVLQNQHVRQQLGLCVKG